MAIHCWTASWRWQYIVELHPEDGNTLLNCILKMAIHCWTASWRWQYIVELNPEDGDTLLNCILKMAIHCWTASWSWKYIVELHPEAGNTLLNSTRKMDWFNPQPYPMKDNISWRFSFFRFFEFMTQRDCDLLTQNIINLVKNFVFFATPKLFSLSYSEIKILGWKKKQAGISGAGPSGRAV